MYFTSESRCNDGTFVADITEERGDNMCYNIVFKTAQKRKDGE